MVKKLLLIMFCLLIFGCSSNTSNITDDFIKKVKKSSSYHLSGEMVLYGDQESFNYLLDVKYLKENNYIVSMINQSNNKEQLILKNNDGLYVITPSLNKSFKFDSNWPDNSSQGYILSSLVKDITSNDDLEINKEKGYVKTNVSYPNNKDLKYEKIYFDKDNLINKVEVYNNDDTIKIKIAFNKVDMNYNAKTSDFGIENFISDSSEESKETIATLEEAIYPLYLPTNTYLNASELITNEDNRRAILTFSGDNNFVIVEEPSVSNQEMEIIPVYGNPMIINNSIAVVSSNTMYWDFNGINYYLASDDLTEEQMVYIATSLGNTRSVIANTK